MVALAAMGILAACGDTVENVTQINQMGMAVVDSAKDLPKCTDENEGEQVFVKDAGTTLICVDGDWVATNSGSSGNPDFSCKTEELKDKSGLKIVCNGDSIGVVLNGATGAGCAMTGSTDSTVTFVCGDSTMVIDLNVGLPNDTLEADSEKVAISLDSLVGFTQKGPFLKGSTVYLYELSDGRTLKQTNGNFTSKITSDDGRYKFSARDLVSQYAMVVVDGYYRNEVTGGTSDAPIRLTALTDMRKRSSVNVNLLTHMEFDRVYNLVTRGDSTGKKLTVKAAKRQAQKEILKQFHIELGENTDAEDMDVFGDSDADAALLAVSVLLQGDSTSSALSVLLTEISNDIAGYGEWKNAAAKAKLADWAMVADLDGRLATIDTNVTNWGLGEAPDFAKYVRNYWYAEYEIGECTDDRNGEIIATKNEKSAYYNTMLRFVCDNGKFRKAQSIEINNNSVCTTDKRGELEILDKDANGKKQYSFYRCTEDGWTFALDTLNKGTVNYEGQTYRTIGIKTQIWMAENLNIDYKVDGSIYGTYTNTNCDTCGRYYTWAAAMDSAGLYSTNSAGCGYGKTCTVKTPARGICPEGWHIPTSAEWNTLYSAIGSSPYAMQAKGYWSDPKDTYGFSALPTGFYEGSFRNVGSSVYFWSATDGNGYYAYGWYLYDHDAKLDSGYNLSHTKSSSFPVRCLKDVE